MRNIANHRPYLALAGLAAVGLAATSCRVNLDLDDGPTVEGAIAVEDFSEVEIDGAFEVFIELGQDATLAYEVPEEAEDRLEISQDGDRLRIGFDDGLVSFNGPIKIHLTTNDLSELKAEGAVKVEIDDLAADELALDLQGATSVEAEGSVGDLAVDSDGAVNLDFGSVDVERAEIDSAGASMIDLSRADYITGEISGASSLDISDDANANVKASGVSSIR